MKKKTLWIGAGVIAAIVVIVLVRKLGAPNETLATFIGSYAAKEGEVAGEYTYSFSYPQGKFSVETSPKSNEIVLKEGDLFTHRIFLIENGKQPFSSPRDLWERRVKTEYASTTCADCTETIVIADTETMRDAARFENAREEWLLFRGGPGFIAAELEKPSENARSVIETFAIVPTEEKTSMKKEDATMKDGLGETMVEKNSSEGTMTKDEIVSFDVYFPNERIAPALTCREVVPVRRTIPKTLAVARAAISELLKGPTAEERAVGYTTSIPDGSELRSITLETGDLHADFNAVIERGGGSCHMASLVEQIRQTLLQFPTVKTVTLSVEGKTEGIFQP